MFWRPQERACCSVPLERPPRGWACGIVLVPCMCSLVAWFRCVRKVLIQFYPESVPVSLWLPPCVFPQSIGRQATKRVSQDSSVKTQVRPMMLGASNESAASLQAKSLRFGHVGCVPVVSRKLGAFK